MLQWGPKAVFNVTSTSRALAEEKQVAKMWVGVEYLGSRAEFFE